MIQPLSLSQRIDAATLIIDGKVIAQQAMWHDAHIITVHQIEIYSILKGIAAANIVSVYTEGGSIGVWHEEVYPSLSLQIGESGVFMLHQENALLPHYALTAGVQGFVAYEPQSGVYHDREQQYVSAKKLYKTIQKYTAQKTTVVKKNPNTAVPAAKSDALQISSFYPTAVKAGIQDVLTIEGNNFGTWGSEAGIYFRDPNEVNLEQYQKVPDNHIISWSDETIKLWIPGVLTNNGHNGAGSGKIMVYNAEGNYIKSDNELQVIFNKRNINFEPIHLVNDNESGNGISFKVAYPLANNAAAMGGINDMLEIWRCETGMNWQVQGATSNTLSSDDGENIITYDLNNTLPIGYIARTRSFMLQCGEDIYLNGADIIISNDYNWNFGDTPLTNEQVDFQSSVLHELGHVIGLGHTLNAASVMYSVLPLGGIKQYIEDNSKEAGMLVMQESSSESVCGFDTFKVFDTANCTTDNNNDTPQDTAIVVVPVDSTDNNNDTPQDTAIVVVPVDSTDNNNDTPQDTAIVVVPVDSTDNNNDTPQDTAIVVVPVDSTDNNNDTPQDTAIVVVPVDSTDNNNDTPQDTAIVVVPVDSTDNNNDTPQDTAIVVVPVDNPEPMICSLLSVEAAWQSACDPNTQTYSQGIMLTYENAPASGYLIVNGQYFPVSGSPQWVVLENLYANGVPVDVFAYFTEQPACGIAVYDLFNAPACIAPDPCYMGGFTIGNTTCNPENNTFQQDIQIYYTAPLGSLFAVNDIIYTATGSPQTVTIWNIPADGSSQSLNIAFLNYPSCAVSLADAFVAPATCLPPPPCSIDAVIADYQSPCDEATQNYSQILGITYSHAPAEGFLVVNGQSFAITNEAPQNIVLSDLPANGLLQDVVIYFSADTTCALTVADIFTAAAPCIPPPPPCAITQITAGGQTACDENTQTFTQEIIVFYENAPADGELIVNGQAFAVVQSPQYILLDNLAADGNFHDVAVSFSESPECATTATNIFAAPAPCIPPPPPCSIAQVAVGEQTACDEITQTFTQEIIVYYENAPADGELVVNGQAFAVTQSPQNITLTNLIANGNTYDIAVVFLADENCIYAAADVFTAPAPCLPPPPCALYQLEVGGQTQCDSLTQTYSQEIIVYYNNAPQTGFLTVNGQNFEITQSPQYVTLNNLPADGSIQDVTAWFSAAPECSFTEYFMYFAPLPCQQEEIIDTPPCTINNISVGYQSGCDTENNTFQQILTVAYNNAPQSGYLSVNGLLYTITESPQTVTLVLPVGTGENIPLTAHFTENSTCVWSNAAVYIVPPVCENDSIYIEEPNAVSCEQNTYCTTAMTKISICPLFCSLSSDYVITEVASLFSCGKDIKQTCVDYTPLPGMENVGEETLTITACDNSGTCETVAITVYINNAANTAPSAQSDSIQVASGVSAYSIDPLLNDSDVNGDSLSICNFSFPQHGFVGLVNNTLTYMPEDGFTGNDFFTYTVCDNSVCDEKNATTTIYLQVGTPCQPEVSYACTDNLTNPLVLCPDFCFGEESYSITALESVFQCGLHQLSDTCVRYVPLPAFSGMDTVLLTACIADGICQTAVYYIHVFDGCYDEEGAGKKEEETNVTTEKWQIPNAFSPNSDGSNDIWKVANGDETTALLQVFTLSGQLVYEQRSTLQQLRWSGDALPEAPYIFVLQAWNEQHILLNKKFLVELKRN
ncbi:MAG: gliding motility-associated C-terminal domain-containing protein [Sphingobacteriales bacterium]|nr:gliding motility-associated C-terminal domain-containing protein [Sphingobacteriales bacterium]